MFDDTLFVMALLLVALSVAFVLTGVAFVVSRPSPTWLREACLAACSAVLLLVLAHAFLGLM